MEIHGVLGEDGAVGGDGSSNLLVDQDGFLGKIVSGHLHKKWKCPCLWHAWQPGLPWEVPIKSGFREDPVQALPYQR